MAESSDVTTNTTEYKVDKPPESDHKDGLGLIADYIAHTPKDKISEVTSLSLDQHRPHSLIGMLSDVLRDMCKRTRDRQARLNKIYSEYHKDKDGEGIIPVDLEKDPAWKIPSKEEGETKLEKWSYYYKQLRRGYKNELLMSLTTLAQAQFETEPQQNPEDILKKIYKDEG